MDLDCSNNRLTQLSARAFADLYDLNCSNNDLTSLNLSGCGILRDLDCSNNRITALDLSDCAELYEAICFDNRLASLNVTGCAGLEILQAHGNGALSFDIGGTALEGLSPTEITTDLYGDTEVMVWHGSSVANYRYWSLTFDPEAVILENGAQLYNAGEPIIPPADLILPAGLTTIGEDAFEAIRARAVLIPESVTTIVGDPFGGSFVAYIYGKPGTAAEDFTIAHPYYTFVPMD